MIIKGIGEFGFQLRNMENGVDTDCGRELKGKGHRGGLGDDGKGADFLLC